MLGFAFVNPSVALVHQDYKRYVSEVISNDSPAELESIAKFLKRTAKDPRQKVLWLIGVNTLKQVQRDWPEEKVSNILFGVFDVAEKLSQFPEIQIADADAETKTEQDRAHTTWRMHQVDFDALLRGQKPGYGAAKPHKESKTTAKTVTPDAPVKLTPVRGTSKPAPDSLVGLFDDMLAGISSEKRRAKAAGWIAAKIEGIFTKEDWAQALARIQQYGIDPDLIRGSLGVYKATGHLKLVRRAVKAVVLNGADHATAMKNGGRLDDLAWLDAHWPLANLTPDVFDA